MKLKVLIFFMFVSGIMFSQKKTYFGLESSVTNDVYEIIEYGNQLKQGPLIGTRLGLSVRHDLNSFLAGEIGFTFKRYHEGFGFRLIPGYGSGSAMSAYCIPLRLYTKINLHKQKIFLSPVIGLSYCISSTPSSTGEQSGKYSTLTDSVQFYSYSYYGLTKTFALIQTGLSIDFVFKNSSSLTVFSSYYTGLSRIFESNITYQINDQPWTNGHAFSKGTFWDVIGISYKIPISNLWQKKNDSKTTTGDGGH